MASLNIPEGLYYFEYILLLLGIALFVTLLVTLIIYTAQKRPPKALLPFFFIPIIMIGYPGIQKLSFDKDGVTLERYIEQLAASPQDTVIRNELKEKLEDIQKRPISQPKTMVNISKGYAALGDTLKAIEIVDDAIITEPGFNLAKNLKQEWNTQGVQIDRLVKEVEQNPDNRTARENLKERITDLEKAPIKDNTAMNRILESSIALEDTTRVLKYVDSVKILTMDDQKRINTLKSRFGERLVE